jgi:hypothetical protein
MKSLISVFVLLGSILSCLPAQSILSSSDLKIAKEFYFIQLKINGKGPYPFMIDTGAGITVIRPELAIQLGLQASGTAQIGTAGKKVTSITWTYRWMALLAPIYCISTSLN